MIIDQIIWLVVIGSTLTCPRKTGHKIRDDAVGVLPLKVIVPITDWKEHYAVAPWMVRLDPDKENGLYKVSSADAFQVRSVSQERFTRRLGELNNKAMNEISGALAVVLSIEI